MGFATAALQSIGSVWSSYVNSNAAKDVARNQRHAAEFNYKTHAEEDLKLFQSGGHTVTLVVFAVVFVAIIFLIKGKK